VSWVAVSGLRLMSAKPLGRLSGMGMGMGVFVVGRGVGWRCRAEL
jgi:hypothetical protein